MRLESSHGFGSVREQQKEAQRRARKKKKRERESGEKKKQRSERRRVRFFFRSTTLVPILAELAFGEQAQLLSLENRLTLVGFYLPYFVAPLWIGTWMLVDNAPFSSGSSGKKAKKR